MKNFEVMWRERVKSSLRKGQKDNVLNSLEKLECLDSIEYTKELVSLFKNDLSFAETRDVFCDSACHMPHEHLESSRKCYQETNSLDQAHYELQSMFRESIKRSKGLSEEEVEKIIEQGMGVAGMLNDSIIIATKIPSMYHDYYSATDPKLRKSFYCHCPRVRSLLEKNMDLDSVYCYCGGGFYKDIWDYITGKEVKIKVLKSLFDGDDVCQFEIEVGK